MRLNSYVPRASPIQCAVCPTKMSMAPMLLRTYIVKDDGVTTDREASVAPNGSYVVPAATSGHMGMMFVFTGRLRRASLDRIWITHREGQFSCGVGDRKVLHPVPDRSGTDGLWTSSNNDICGTKDRLGPKSATLIVLTGGSSSIWPQANIYAALTGLRINSHPVRRRWSGIHADSLDNSQPRSCS